MKNAIALFIALSASIVSADVTQETDSRIQAERETDRIADELNEAARQVEKSLQHTRTEPYWTDGKWKVTASNSTCSLQGSEPFAVEYDDRLSRFRIFFFAPGTKSLREGEKRTVKIAFIQKTPQIGWFANANLQVMAVYNEGRTFLVGDTYQPLFQDLSRSDFIAFYTQQDVLIISVGLAGTGKAIPHLMRCAERQQRLHPSDPFAR